jgi:hypothetical protein
MLRIERAKGAIPVLAFAMLLLSGAPAVLAHQCVAVEILRSPDAATPGDLIVTESSATNCGDPARAFQLTWMLVSENNDYRILLKRTAAKIEPDRTITGFNRLLLPTRLRPGIYHLVNIGEAPSGFTANDAARIEIRARRGPRR